MTGYDDYDLQAERLSEYRALAVYARGYRQAVDAEDPVWEPQMGRELDAALLRVRRLEARFHVEVGL